MGSIPFYAKRFVSGSNFEEAFSVVEKLNDKKICVTLDVLGENIKDKPQALKFVEEYDLLLKRIAEKQRDCYVSIKLTMLGLDIDHEFCYENLSRILSIADEKKIRVALDMEGTDYTERTIAMYERAAKEFTSPEIVLQAYLLRTEEDINRILAANGKIRLCKGAYKEPQEKALQKMPLIVENYKKLIQKLLLNGKRVCIASHDDEIIESCGLKKSVEENDNSFWSSTTPYIVSISTISVLIVASSVILVNIIRKKDLPLKMYFPASKYCFKRLLDNIDFSSGSIEDNILILPIKFLFSS